MRFCVHLKNKPSARRTSYMHLISCIHHRGSETVMLFPIRKKYMSLAAWIRVRIPGDILKRICLFFMPLDETNMEQNLNSGLLCNTEYHSVLSHCWHSVLRGQFGEILTQMESAYKYEHQFWDLSISLFKFIQILTGEIYNNNIKHFVRLASFDDNYFSPFLFQRFFS